MLYPQKLSDVFDALYRAFWIERQTIGKPEVIGAALSGVLTDAEVKTVLEKLSAPEVKKALIQNGELAIKEGAFGLPWFVATNAKGEREGFWGFDHLGQVIDHLGLERTDQGLRAML